MRSKADARLNRRATRGTALARSRDKVLQRLFAFLGQRDPSLNDDVVAGMAVAKRARQGFGFTKRARNATAYDARMAKRARPVSAAATSFASARLKAIAAAALQAQAAVAWQPIGPARIPNGQTYGTNRTDVSGRVSSLAIDPGDPAHLLLGAAGGGIWESADGGTTWAPRTDRLPSLAIGAVVFDPADPKRVYAGSGEGNFYSTLGAGVYQSIDGGTTWTVAALGPFKGVGFFRLVVDPKDSSVLYGATTSGFYKSIDRGASWSLKRGVPCWDLSVHPNGGASEVLATFSDGLFVSTNAGNLFAAVTLPSTPSTAWARLSVDRVTTAPDVAYVFGAAGTAAHLWRRAGATWTKITSVPASLDISQAWYDWYVAATFDSSAQVFLGAIDGFRGDLTGSTWKWTNITTQGSNSIHPDQHCLTFAPNSSKVIYAGNDGGLFTSKDSGATWKALNAGLAISEIEYLAGDPATWKWMMAGTQDNGTIAFTGTPVWTHIADGDGGDCGVNQLNANIIYHSYYSVSLERSANKGTTWTDLNPPNVASLFYPPVEVFGATVAIGATSLLITRTGAAPWQTIPLGLGANEVSSAMREIDANTILVGTNLGGMIRVAWNGTSWKKTQLASPAARYISCIAVDPSNPQRVWLTISQVGGGQVYRSDNGGTSWINTSSGLPGIPFNAVVVDPADFKRIWVAADVGVYQTLDLGASWSLFSTGLPNALVVDLLLHKQDRMLVCATRNRGAWAIPVT
jgi:photosystem II stability/assembly factor-like uncharacterized protein